MSLFKQALAVMAFVALQAGYTDAQEAPDAVCAYARQSNDGQWCYAPACPLSTRAALVTCDFSGDCDEPSCKLVETLEGGTRCALNAAKDVIDWDEDAHSTYNRCGNQWQALTAEDARALYAPGSACRDNWKRYLISHGCASCAEEDALNFQMQRSEACQGADSADCAATPINVPCDGAASALSALVALVAPAALAFLML